MSVSRNLAGAYVPVRERREATGTLAALNAEVVLPLNGDRSALVVVSSAAFIGTLEFTGAADSAASIFFPIPAYTFAPGSAGGTIPLAGQPLLVDALVAANTLRVYSVPVSQLKALRVRASAYTSGSLAVTVITDTNDELNTAIDSKPSTLLVTATGAAAAAVTATLPAVAGLRHIIDRITVVRSATAALTAAATPVVITSTNIPGSFALTLGQDAGGIGVDRELTYDAGSTGLAAVALGTATTVVCPAYTGVIWRVIVGYRLGL